jgi:hypothetical protein
MKPAFRASIALLCAALLSPGCGSPDIGEECDDVGSTDACEDGALCTNEDQGAVCRKLCDATEDCPANHSCNGVSGTNLKSCQPDAV